MIQYTNPGTIPAAVQTLVANKVGLLDVYLLCQTDQYEYTALVQNLVTQDCTQIVVSRQSNNSTYQVAVSDGTWDWSLTNEYYCYSNVGYGSALSLPVYDGVIAHASVIMCCALMLAIVFKGVLFPWRRKG